MLYPIRNWKITVSQAIIDRAQPDSQSHCLKAEAIRECIPGIWSVRVSADSATFNLGGSHLGPDPDDKYEATRFHYPFPGRVTGIAADFDKRGKKERESFKPFTFTLDKRTGTSAPVMWRGPATQPYRKRKTHTKSNTQRRCSVRRHAGLAVISGKAKRGEADAN